VLELFSGDAEWRPAFIGGGLVEGSVYRGHEGVAEFVEMQAETWASVAAHPVEIREVDDRVLVEVQLNAIGRASGVAVNRRTWNVFEMRGGEVASGRAFATRAEALEAAGRSK
jgi:ketosteroid isomerase-like protein